MLVAVFCPFVWRKSGAAPGVGAALVTGRGGQSTATVRPMVAMRIDSGGGDLPVAGDVCPNVSRVDELNEGGSQLGYVYRGQYFTVYQVAPIEGNLSVIDQLVGEKGPRVE